MLGAQKSRPSKILRMAPSLLGLDVLDAPLDADRRRHLVNGGRVERRGQADRLGKLRGAVHRDAVQGLAPPVVRGHPQARDGACLVDELRGFLLQRHALHQVGGALFGREAGV